MKKFNGNPAEILLVEDNEGDARLAAEALKDGKISNNLHHVKDGIEAMQFLRKEAGYQDVPRPDVILLDLNMPRMDGFGVIETVRADPKHRDMPILTLTTESAPELKQRARNAGATGWIVKPFDPVKLINVIRRVAA